MKNILFIPIFLISIQGCGQKNMSPENFKKANWINHSKGIDYISISERNAISLKKDSFEIKLRAVSSDGNIIEEVNSSEKISEVEDFIITLIEKIPSEITSGYLRINTSEIFKPNFPEIVVYLTDTYDSASAFKNDSISLIKIPGINTFNFISKKTAKTILFGNGNNDWSNVLDANPILPYFSVKLEQREWTKIEMEEIKAYLSKTIPSVTEIYYPEILLKKNNFYTFFEFKRI